MVTLGIDSSKHKTGFAILRDGKLIYKKIDVFDKKMSIGEHLKCIKSRIYTMIRLFSPNLVIVEDLNIRHMAAARHMFLYHGVIKEVVFSSTGKDAIYVVNSTWRSKLGIKNPTKDEKISKAVQIGIKKNGEPKMREYDIKCRTLEYINDKMGLDLDYEDNDLADAIGLCIYGEEHYAENVYDGDNS